MIYLKSCASDNISHWWSADHVQSIHKIEAILYLNLNITMPTTIMSLHIAMPTAKLNITFGRPKYHWHVIIQQLQTSLSKLPVKSPEIWRDFKTYNSIPLDIHASHIVRLTSGAVGSYCSFTSTCAFRTAGKPQSRNCTSYCHLAHLLGTHRPFRPFVGWKVCFAQTGNRQNMWVDKMRQQQQ